HAQVPVVDARRDRGRERRVVLAVDRERHPARGHLAEDRLDQPAGGAVLLHHRDDAVGQGRPVLDHAQNLAAGAARDKPRYPAPAPIASISTAIPPGRLAMPTALRAPTPASPKTSRNRSEQPLMTCGCSVNSGVAFTMPSTLTIRTTKSSEPSCARSV